ncbi:MAG: hypothetical protein E7630_06005 [Ruminococcaceae bacterium]|nr:hypothetical protein [Oscillospiraceae bacterium]
MKTAQGTKKADLFGLLGIFGTLALMAATLILSERAAGAAQKGLLLCGKTLIPAIFPFLVLNGLLMRLGFPEWIGRRIGKPVGRLFGISPACVAAVVVGLFSGFPTGAAAAHRICQGGLGSDGDRNRTVLLSSVAAPGFLIVGIGGRMLDSPHRGLALYLFQLAAIVTVGIVNARPFGQRAEGALPVPVPRRKSLFLALGDALRDAADATVGICGAVIFFSALGGMIALLPLPDSLTCLLVCFLEITSGASLAASLLPAPLAFVMIAGAVGWAGCSVHAQTVMVTDGKLKVGGYLLSKCLTALLTALFAAAALFFGFV